jgi:hypothetical protein
VVGDGIMFVSVRPWRISSHLAKAIKSASAKDDEEESNESDYDEHKEQLEEEQEEHTGEVTINQVF